MKQTFHIFCVTLCCCLTVLGQENDKGNAYKNQVSTNLILPFFSSVDLSYEHTLGKKFAFGLAGAIYGNRFEKLTTGDSYNDRQLKTKYEVMPFARVYFGGNQKKSHFLEMFGSVSRVDETGRKIRNTNQQGYGVYVIGTEGYTRGGFGAGYGYRFLFLENKLVAEAQIGIRTNFDVNFIVLNAALVRTGIKIGYRF